MTAIPIIVNGLPGNMARTVVRQAAADPRFRLLPLSLTGPEIEQSRFAVDQLEFTLIRPDQRKRLLDQIDPEGPPPICIDYTHPAAVNSNAEFYCANNLPFVMGTTGGDRQKLATVVENSSTAAVIAPNMAKQIVGFQAMMEYAAENFPGIFKGYRLTIEESHQAGKADTSGTAKAMVRYFNKMGIDFSAEQIIKIRDPEIQKNRLKVPEPFLGGHGWHTYTLVSPDETVTFRFVHNVNGRRVYAEGTLDAVSFLSARLAEGAGGKVYSMIDVLRAAC